MNNSRTVRLVAAALLAAMTCVATMIIKIPVQATGGYINLGDSIVMLSGFVLGPVLGGVSAGLGSALADLLSGYAVYIPATFIIKGLMAVAAGLLIKDIRKKSIFDFLWVCLVSELIMIGGYLLFEAIILGYGKAALAAVVGNAVQGVAGIAVTVLLLPVVKRLDIQSLRSAEKTTKQ